MNGGDRLAALRAECSRRAGAGTAAALSAMAAARPEGPAATTYAIGDVHGEARELAALLEVVAADASRRGGPWRIVMLGDYVDRGEDPAAAVATVRFLEASLPEGALVALMGNHEQMMLLSGEADDDWNRDWGVPTLRSYSPFARTLSDVPADVVAWIGSLPTWHRDAERLYVHAGLRPGVPLALQDDEARLWSRRGFADADEDFGVFVVHGHTPVPGHEPDLRRNRLNLDTGCARGGHLSAAAFVAGRVRPVAFLDAVGATAA